MNARDVKNVPGRPKTDKLDAVWLAKLNERGMLRPSFVPPAEIRELRDYTRLRAELVEERSRHKQRIEKLLEDASIKLSTVATDIFGKSGRAMLEALIAGERDPEVLADLALGKMRPKRAALREALTGRFDAHHAELARMLLDEIDALSEKIDRLTTRVDAARRTSSPRHSRRRSQRRRDRSRWPLGPRAPRRGPRHRTAGRTGHRRRDRPRHGPVPDRRPPRVLGQALAAHDPVRATEPLGQDRQGQPLPEGRPRRGRRPPPRGPTRSSASATGASCAGGAVSAPSSRSPARSSSSSGTFSPTRTPASSTSVRTSTSDASTRTARTRDLVRQLQALGHQVTLSPAA